MPSTIEAMTLALSMVHDMGKWFSPGTTVISLMVAFPMTPAAVVERMRVTLPRAMVMTDGLGMNATPTRLGLPGVAVRLSFISLTAKPLSPFNPVVVSFVFELVEEGKNYLCM